MSATTSRNGTPTNATAQPDPTPPPGRDASGRFAAGNRYGPGNPFARQTAQLRKALLEVVTPEELRQVAFTLLLLAKAGKLEATKLLFQYVLGKPAEGVDPDRLEVQEWKLSQESRVNPVAVHETVNQLPAEAANVLVRHTWPASTETNYLSAVREELEAMDAEDAQRARAAREQAPAEANRCDGERSAKPRAADPGPRPLPAQERGEQEVGPCPPGGEGGTERRPAPAKGRKEGGAGGDRPAGGGKPPRPPKQAHRHRTEANGGNGARVPVSDARRRSDPGPGRRAAGGAHRPGGG